MRNEKRHSESRLRGTVVAYNISPKGHIEGATVDTSNGLAQLNFPKHDAERMARAMAVGSVLDLPVELEHDDGDHPVYVPNEEEEGPASGTIVRLNYALHGEVNGCHLDDGTFVHLKPEKAKQYKLEIGTKITATGERRTGADAVVLDAKTVSEAPGRVRKARARG